MRIRSKLNFDHRHGWLILHVLTDLVLLTCAVLSLLFVKEQSQLDLKSLAVAVLAIVVGSVFCFRSFAMMHEAVHGCVSANRSINYMAGLVYGAFCFLPFQYWRQIHLLHHKWAGNVERDPVMKLVLDFRKPPTRSRALMSTLWRSWFPILAILQHYVFWFACAGEFKKEPKWSGALSLAFPLAFWFSVFLAAGMTASLVILVPTIVLYLAVVETINFPHHMSLPQYEGETRLALWEQFRIARSCWYPRALSRFVLLNFNYHTEHHLFPTLPWYELDKLSVVLKQDLPGYNFTIGNQWIRENRKKSLEDVAKGVPESAVTKAA